MSVRPPAAALALLLLPPAIWAAQRRIDARPGAGHLSEQRLAVWSGDAIRKLLPGLEQVMADVYWLRAVQYYGGERYFNRNSRFPLLEPLIDITVDLDPRFLLGYRYGAIFLAEHWPSGAGRPEAAEALLRRGIEVNPEAWELYWDLGMIRYLFTREPEAAAEALLEGAALPGAPSWLISLGGRILTHADQRETSRMIWRQVYAEHDGAMQENARMNLLYLDALDAIDLYRERLDAFHRRAGSWPPSLASVAGAGGAVLPLADPTGEAFDYNPATGAVGLSPASALWTLIPDDEKLRSVS